MEDTRYLAGALVGASVGAFVGLLLRGGFTIYNLTHPGIDSESNLHNARLVLAFFALIASPVFGLISGTIAGAIGGALGRPFVGALVGMVLSLGFLFLFLIPAYYAATLFQLQDNLRAFSVLYFIQKGIAGALAGGLGGLAGLLTRIRPQANAKSNVESPSPKPVDWRNAYRTQSLFRDETDPISTRN